MKRLVILFFLLAFGSVSYQDTLISFKKPDTRWQMLTYDLGTVFGGLGYTFAVHYIGKKDNGRILELLW